jgi:hypothetical protein
MNKIPCLYSIVQFSPFVETGEFANVGILIMAPEQGFFAFKLMGRRHSRVTHFFEQLESQVFRSTMNSLREELERAGKALRDVGFDRRRKTNDVEFAKRMFSEIVRPRETVIKFSEARAVLADVPGLKLEELYGHYVERDFVTRKYQEAVLERGMRKWLWQARIAERFIKHEVGNDEYHVTFPFVEKREERLLQAIKPLHLAQDQPSKILDHGGQWIFRINTLKRKNFLPEKVLLAVGGPQEVEGPRRKAYEEIVDTLKDTGVTVLPFFAKEQILEFVGDQPQSQIH